MTTTRNVFYCLGILLSLLWVGAMGRIILTTLVGYSEPGYSFWGIWWGTILGLAALGSLLSLGLIRPALKGSVSGMMEAPPTGAVGRAGLTARISGVVSVVWAVAATGISDSQSLPFALLSCAGVGLPVAVLVYHLRYVREAGLSPARRLLLALVGALFGVCVLLPPCLQFWKNQEWRNAANEFAGFSIPRTTASIVSPSIATSDGISTGVVILDCDGKPKLSPAWHHLPNYLRANRRADAGIVVCVTTEKRQEGSFIVAGHAGIPFYRRKFIIRIYDNKGHVLLGVKELDGWGLIWSGVPELGLQIDKFGSRPTRDGYGLEYPIQYNERAGIVVKDRLPVEVLGALPYDVAITQVVLNEIGRNASRYSIGLWWDFEK